MLLENENMPYRRGNADIPDHCVDYVVRSDEPLFIMPHQPLTVLEHAIGSYVGGPRRLTGRPSRSGSGRWRTQSRTGW